MLDIVRKVCWHVVNFPSHFESDDLPGASKIQIENVNKRDLTTLLFSSLQNSEGGGGDDGDSGNSCADP